MKILNGEGKKFWKQGNYTQALEHYNIAYDVCQRYNLLQDLLVILGNLAQVYLKMELFEQSYTFATMLVKRDPKSEKVHVCLMHIFFWDFTKIASHKNDWLYTVHIRNITVNIWLGFKSIKRNLDGAKDRCMYMYMCTCK